MKFPRITQLIACLLFVTVITACASGLRNFPKTPSVALTDVDDTRLATSSARWISAEPDRNGFFPLTNGKDAFGARLALIDRAEKSIDAQYFLMKSDTAGLVFSKKLIEAANRGVRVRFLLDDIFTTVDDGVLIVLDKHPNIEMRVFNPISRWGSQTVNYFANFKIANRRMHNKSFIVDNSIAIVGGRNIAEEYFQLQTQEEFLDFDMLSAGPVVKDVSVSFDTYWNHELAVPMEAFYDNYSDKALEEIRRRINVAFKKTGESVYAKAIDTKLMREFNQGVHQPYFADAEVIIDDPEKLLQKISDESKIVATAIAEAMRKAEKEIIIFTPYFIPGKHAHNLVKELTSRGVRIILFTNSLATNNHIAVHSAYSSHRKSMLRAGMELWEARANAAQLTYDVNVMDEEAPEQLTLHTKGIMIDRRYIFVGSLNLDPRSIDINTEMGVMIDSKELVREMAIASLNVLPEIGYKLELTEKNKINWRAMIGGVEVVETSEPLSSRWRRFKAVLLKVLPEKQL